MWSLPNFLVGNLNVPASSTASSMAWTCYTAPAGFEVSERTSLRSQYLLVAVHSFL